MTRYCFHWSFSGSTVLEAVDMAAAEKEFDRRMRDGLVKRFDVEFVLDEVVKVGVEVDA